MKLIRHILPLICLISLCSCEKTGMTVSDPQIVVEGWIENGSSPVVILTSSVSVTEEIKNVNELSDYIIRWGKVTISDGTQSVVLTGTRNNNYFPPYIYTTGKIKGEVGKRYDITVEYGGKTVTASTTIPEPVELEYLKVNRSEEDSEKVYLTAGLKDDPNKKNYYKTFIKILNKDKYYQPSFMGLLDDAVLSEGVDEIPVNNCVSNLFEKHDSNFHVTDTVMVRFCTLDEVSFQYWSDYDTISSLSTNPFFPATTKIRSNIRGGLGYWAGYGSTYYTVAISESLTD